MISSEVNPTKVNVTKAADIPTAPTQANMIGPKVKNSKPKRDKTNQQRKNKAKQTEPQKHNIDNKKRKLEEKRTKDQKKHTNRKGA